jgi:hypothetical protein
MIRVGNRKPTAVFEYTPQFVARGKPVSFRSRSSDPEGRLGGHRWDLDGDGQFDDGAGDTARATFNGTKPVSVGLRVSDRDGGIAERRMQIVPGNRPPDGTIAVSPDPPQPGVPTTLAADVTDADGSVAGLAWDLDDDGEFDDGEGERVAWTFATVGMHRVSLRATDNDGSSAVIVRELAVGSTAPTTVAGGAKGGRSRLRLMDPFPVVRIAGRLTRRGARLRLISVRAGRGARIELRCLGKGCRPQPVVARISAKKAKKARHFKRFQRAYRAGTRLEIRVTAPRRIGKYTRIRIRKGKAPARVDKCLVPGSRKPQACPS